MPIYRYSNLSWREIQDLHSRECVALLPIGAIEAHGPHLPLATDNLISDRMTVEAARLLSNDRTTILIMPQISYSAAPFAADFPGTISLRPQLMTGLIVDIGRSLVRSGINLLGIANAHLDPTHLGSVHHAVQALSDGGALKIAFPDLTQKPWARRLTDEFKSGACHAGQFETSIVLASRPDLVDEDLRKSLEPNPVSLSVAIRDGKTSFKAAGGDQAYFGDPSEATAAEGTETITILGKILADAVRERSDLEL